MLRALVPICTLPQSSVPPAVSHPTPSPLFFALPIDSIDTHSRYPLLRFDLSSLCWGSSTHFNTRAHISPSLRRHTSFQKIPEIPNHQQTSTKRNKTNSFILSTKMKKITIAAVLALASQAFAEPLPYRPAKAFLSAREIFGLGRRDTDDVYHPKQSVCGMAETCSEAVRQFIFFNSHCSMEANV